jgi:hypothetical protein
MNASQEKLHKDLQEQQNILVEQTQKAENASKMYSAHMELYNVAASSNDDKVMEDERAQLHALLDAMLDATALSLSAQQRQQSIILGWRNSQ